MSNDLISRKSVFELIESKIVDGVLCQGEDHPLIDANELIDDVTEICTAYDVDKVIEQLNDAKHCNEVGSCYHTWLKSANRCIGIVKEGGV